MRGISRGGTYEIYVEQWFYVNEVPLADPGGGGGAQGARAPPFRSAKTFAPAY